MRVCLLLRLAEPIVDMKKALLLVLIQFAIAGELCAQSVDQVDAFVKASMERESIPGVSIAVIKDGKPFIVKGYGLANVEHNVAVKPETIFQSGSVGKQFTAFAVMILVEEGKIGHDDPLSKYIADVPNSWKPLTIRRLLTHTSGLGDYPTNFDLQKDGTEEKIFKELQKMSPTFKQGDKWEYSNVAYVTLGVLIRKVTGRFYGDFLRERVFQPLGMVSTRIISEADIVPNRAAGYRLLKGELKNQEWVAPSLNTTADGSLYTNALDLIRWDEALRAGRILKKRSYDEIWSPVKLNNGSSHPYGFGWELSNINGKRLVEHGGSWQGFKTHIARYVDHKLTVIVFANLAQANQDQIAHGIAQILDPSTKQ